MTTSDIRLLFALAALFLAAVSAATQASRFDGAKAFMRRFYP